MTAVPDRRERVLGFEKRPRRPLPTGRTSRLLGGSALGGGGGGRGLIRGEGRRSWLPSLWRTRGPEPPAGPGPRPDRTVLTPDGPAEALAGGGRCRAGVRGACTRGRGTARGPVGAHGHAAVGPVARGFVHRRGCTVLLGTGGLVVRPPPGGGGRGVWVWGESLLPRCPGAMRHWYGCAGRLFGLVRHPGTATAAAEAGGTRLCGAACGVFSQQLLPLPGGWAPGVRPSGHAAQHWGMVIPASVPPAPPETNVCGPYSPGGGSSMVCWTGGGGGGVAQHPQLMCCGQGASKAGNHVARERVSRACLMRRHSSAAETGLARGIWELARESAGVGSGGGGGGGGRGTSPEAACLCPSPPPPSPCGGRGGRKRVSSTRQAGPRAPPAPEGEGVGQSAPPPPPPPKKSTRAPSLGALRAPRGSTEESQNMRSEKNLKHWTL